MNLNRFTLTALLIGSMLVGGMIAPPPPAHSATREYWEWVSRRDALIQEIHGHVASICKSRPKTGTCNRVELERNTLFQSLQYMKPETQLYKLANFAGKLRATK
jgi:hypothetical protein